MTPAIRAAVVVPAYRNPGIAGCLEALMATQDADCPFLVHVVLNDATQEVEEAVAAFGAGVTRTRLPANAGISGGFNRGFAAVATEFVVQLQDDARVQSGWLRHLIESADAAPDAGAIASLTLNDDGLVLDPGWIVAADGRTTPGLVGGSRAPHDYVGTRPIDYHGSAGMLVRRRAWESIGGFDHEFYPAYYGDVDFCWRLRRRGWRVLLDPRAQVQHSGNLSSTSHYREFLIERNRARFVSLHGSALDACTAIVGDTASVDRAIAAVAASPRGPVPSEPTDQDIVRLRDRLSVEPEAFLRLERDVRAEYATWLEGRLEGLSAERRAAHDQLERQQRSFAHELAEAGERERVLTARLEKCDRRVAEAEEANRRFAASRSWRMTKPLRDARRRLRRDDTAPRDGQIDAP